EALVGEAAAALTAVFESMDLRARAQLVNGALGKQASLYDWQGQAEDVARNMLDTMNTLGRVSPGSPQSLTGQFLSEVALRAGKPPRSTDLTLKAAVDELRKELDAHPMIRTARQGTLAQDLPTINRLSEKLAQVFQFLDVGSRAKLVNASVFAGGSLPELSGAPDTVATNMLFSMDEVGLVSLSPPVSLTWQVLDAIAKGA